MLAALSFDREPLRWEDMPAMLVHWTQVAGGLAAVAVVLWLIFGLPALRPADRQRISGGQRMAFILACLGALACYAFYGAVRLPDWLRSLAADAPDAAAAPMRQPPQWLTYLLTVGGVCALLAAGNTFLANLTRLRWRRIGAIASLSFKEAVRRRVLLVFALLGIVFLFANWYVPSKPEDQIRTYVGIVYYAMGPLLLISALVLSSFSIPNDINQQTIHTVLTKPVERFEVVLGRFLGFVAILTVMLVVMTALGLGYVIRNVDPAAAYESLKARVPEYGELTFDPDPKGISVGREWDYRRYISGEAPPKPEQAAIWSFDHVPSVLEKREVVPCEFTFDIYRTHKGQENKGINCRFVFTTWNYRKGNEQEYNRRKPARDFPAELEKYNELTKELGYFEIAGQEVVDYHTQTIILPAGLFINALKNRPDKEGRQDKAPVPVQVRVTCNSQSQYVGMARYDLFLRLDDPDGTWDRLWFAWNFFKGAAGLWFALVLICGLGVAISTYLSGVITLLLTGLLYIGGMFQDFIRTVGEGTNVGGGPLEAIYRIASRTNLSAPIEETSAIRFATGSDLVFRWVVRRLLDILPDVDRYSLTAYVGEGFNIPGAQLLLHTLILLGYLLPWALLAYYLLRWREIAGPT